MSMKPGNLDPAAIGASTTALANGTQVPDWALTLTQPWASLVAWLEKSIETRDWSTAHRGPLAITAAKSFPREAKELCNYPPFSDVIAAHGHTIDTLPLGAIVCTVDVRACYRFDERTLRIIAKSAAAGRQWPRYEHHFGDFAAGRFGFRMEHTIALPRPVPVRGFQKLWKLPADARAALAAALEAV